MIAMAVCLAFSSVASAATLFFDFGDSGQTTVSPPAANVYNNIIVNPPGVLSIADTVNSTGANTGISINVSGFFNGSNQSGPTSPSGNAGAIFDGQATRDNAFGHAGTFGTNPLTPQATIALSGLDGSGLTTYDFTFFGSRQGATDNRETKYDVTGANNGFALLNTTANVSEVVSVTGITPTAGGNITLLVSPGPNNNNSSLFYYLGAMRIVSTTIPEPATFGLFALAGIACVVSRRACR